MVVESESESILEGNSVELATMFAENLDGLSQYVKLHEYGPIFERAKLELVSSVRSGERKRITTSVSKYTILSRDCLGTDSCKKGYEWTVIATSVGDGYTYETKYENSFKKRP